MIQLLSLIAAGLAIFGAILNACKRIEGFVFWIISNFIWIFIGIHQKNYGMILMFSVYTIISAIGIYKWRRSNI